MQRRACVRTISEAECAVSRPLSKWRPISELTEGWDKGGGECLAEEIDGRVAASKRKRCYLNTFNWFPHQPFHVTGHITYYHARKKKDTQLVGVSTCTFQCTNKTQTRERWKGQSSAKVVSSLLRWTRSLRATLIKCRMDRGLVGVQMDDP